MKLTDNQIYECAKSFTEIVLQNHKFMNNTSAEKIGEETAEIFDGIVKKLKSLNK